MKFPTICRLLVVISVGTVFVQGCTKNTGAANTDEDLERKYLRRQLKSCISNTKYDSSIDFFVLHSRWFEAAETTVCANGDDDTKATCWEGALGDILSQYHTMYSPIKSCIATYKADAAGEHLLGCTVASVDNSENNAAQTLVPHNTAVEYTCSTNFLTPSGKEKFTSTCDDGTMKPTVEECHKTNSNCNGKNIACATDNEFIVITSTFYGRKDTKKCPSKIASQNQDTACSLPTAFEQTKKKCDDLKTCDVKPDNLFTDPCPSTKKYTIVTWQCKTRASCTVVSVDNSENNAAQTLVPHNTAVEYTCSTNFLTPSGKEKFTSTCDDGTMKPTVEECHKTTSNCNGKNIECATDNEFIVITSTFYGRKDTKKCPSKIALQNQDTACSLPTAFEQTKKKCDGLKTCNVSPDNLFTDPCPSTKKYTIVTWQCKTRTSRLLCQNKKLVITCANTHEIKFHSAFYGRKSATECVSEAVPAGGCSSAGALQAIKTRCDGKTTCTITARNSDMGGNPCSGTQNSAKYAELEWECKLK